MNERQVHEAFARLRSLSGKIAERSGPGFVDVYSAHDGQLHLHKVTGTKSLSEFEDDLLNAVVWAWSLKDYLKEAAKAHGNDPQQIENLANSSEALGLISDLANRSKHGSLRKSRSGRFAKLGEVSMSIPQSAIRQITFSASMVSTDVADATHVQFHAPVQADSGEVLAEAGECLVEAISIWENSGLRCATGA